MKITGGCYCGELRYEADVEPLAMVECHCRECQFYALGGASYNLVIPRAGFKYTSGTPVSYTRPDFKNAATREFCPTCHTLVLTYGEEKLPGGVVLKAGSMDDPSLFYPQMVVHAGEKQAYHALPEIDPTFEAWPTQESHPTVSSQDAG